MIPELSRRKPYFDEINSVPVRLADGQEWFVPKPWVELWPRFESGAARTAFPLLTCGPSLDVLIKAIAESQTYGELLSASATLGARMLQHQYDLSDADLDTLFCGSSTDPESWSWVRRIVDVATGRDGPKVSRVGDA